MRNGIADYEIHHPILSQGQTHKAGDVRPVLVETGAQSSTHRRRLCEGAGPLIHPHLRGWPDRNLALSQGYVAAKASVGGLSAAKPTRSAEPQMKTWARRFAPLPTLICGPFE